MDRPFKVNTKLTVALLLGVIVLSCSESTPTGGASKGSLQGTVPIASIANTPPVIHQLTANPTAQVATGDKISFTVEASDSEKDALKYYWSSDQGQLSAREGYSVYWQPTPNAQPGVSTVSLTVVDGKGGEAQAFAKLMLKADGSAQVGLISRVTCGDGTNRLDQLYANGDL